MSNEILQDLKEKALEAEVNYLRALKEDLEGRVKNQKEALRLQDEHEAKLRKELAELQDKSPSVQQDTLARNMVNMKALFMRLFNDMWIMSNVHDRKIFLNAIKLNNHIKAIKMLKTNQSCINLSLVEAKYLYEAVFMEKPAEKRIKRNGEFLPGDRVQCVDDKGTPCLVRGQIYTVTRASSQTVDLNELGSRKDWDKDRFIHAEE